MNGFKAFGIGLGATAGVILGVYVGIKGIETIGYLSCKNDQRQAKKYQDMFEAQLKEAARAIAAGETPKFDLTK
jgi:hypothetical protein